MTGMRINYWNRRSAALAAIWARDPQQGVADAKALSKTISTRLFGL